jgi:hypothetical protein
VTVWSIAKWPLIALVLSQIVALLYWVAPNVRQPSYRWIGPGSLLAVALWLVASVAFASYVANFGSFKRDVRQRRRRDRLPRLAMDRQRDHPARRGGHAELERDREIEGGHSVDREPFLPPRKAPRFGIIGLGRMGGNLACAALEHGHDVVGFDRDERLTTALAREGLEAAASLQELTAPRTVLVSGGARRPR